MLSPRDYAADHPCCVCCARELDPEEFPLEVARPKHSSSSSDPSSTCIVQQLDGRRRRTSISYWDYPSVNPSHETDDDDGGACSTPPPQQTPPPLQPPPPPPRISLRCGHPYCSRCFHRYVCASESDCVLTCVHCGGRTELASEITERPVYRFRLKRATSMCVDNMRNTYLVIDSILNRCFEFPVDIDTSNRKVKSHALLNGSRPTQGVVAMKDSHVVATRDRKRSFLAFYSLAGKYRRAIYLPQGTVVKGLEKLEVKNNKSLTDAAWIVADGAGCRLLKISETDEIMAVPLYHVEPRPDITAMSLRGRCAYVCDNGTGNVLEVDTWTGRVTRTVGAQFPSPSDVFACPYAGFLLVSDAAAASVCRVPTAIGIRVGDYDDEGTDAEDADDRDERHPVRYEVVGACCLLRPVGVASARSDSVAVLLAAVGNVEIAEVRFYRV